MHRSTCMMMAALPLLWATNTFATEERIQLGPHMHGHGKLDMALEGNRLEMELNSPGMDIVGFEHKAHSDNELYDPVWVKGRMSVKNVSKKLSLVDGNNWVDAGYSLFGESIEKYNKP